MGRTITTRCPSCSTADKVFMFGILRAINTWTSCRRIGTLLTVEYVLMTQCFQPYNL